VAGGRSGTPASRMGGTAGMSGFPAMVCSHPAGGTDLEFRWDGGIGEIASG
jgi:hypothetical protein